MEINVVANCYGLRRHTTVGNNAETKLKTGDQANARSPNPKPKTGGLTMKT